ncbi:MAG: peptidylprolyl isomerase [Nitrococcus mobilis]|nr:peptidylprolyl isomerase [Nitrococcus mobilis]
MQVAKGKVVAISYTLRTNGVIRYISQENKPLEYLHGAGNIIPGLEKALEGKANGDQFSITVPPEEGYGARDETLQQKVPAEIFRGVKQLEPGMQFQAQSEDNKRLETVTIVDVDEEEQTVTLDTNHPLAGQTLEFDVIVNSVREATESELERGYVTSPRVPERARYRPSEPPTHDHHEHDHSHDHHGHNH